MGPCRRGISKRNPHKNVIIDNCSSESESEYAENEAFESEDAGKRNSSSESESSRGNNTNRSNGTIESKSSSSKNVSSRLKNDYVGYIAFNGSQNTLQHYDSSKLPDCEKGRNFCIGHFGEVRKEQINALANLLGDLTQPNAFHLSNSMPVLQVIGLPGAGKTSLITTFLKHSNVPYCYVDCQLLEYSSSVSGSSSCSISELLFSPVLSQLAHAFHISKSKAAYSATSFDSFLQKLQLILMQWKAKHVNYAIPTPVLVFDNYSCLEVNHELVLNQLFQLPSLLCANDDIALLKQVSSENERYCPDVVIILIARRPSALPPNISFYPPTIWFPAYTKANRVEVLTSMFSTVAIKLVKGIVKEPECECVVELSDSKTESESNQWNSCNGCRSDDSVIIAQALKPTGREESFWRQFHPLDCDTKNHTICRLKIHYDVLKALWGTFLFKDVTTFLEKNSLSDFHETLLMVRRLWCVYLKPLLELQPIILHALDISTEEVVEKLSYCFRSHPLALHILNTPFVRYISNPPDIRGLLSPIPEVHVRPEWTQPELKALQRNHHVQHKQPARVEGSRTALLLLLAAFVASHTKKEDDRALLSQVQNIRRKKSSVLRKDQNRVDLVNLCSEPFTFQRWMYLTEILGKMGSDEFVLESDLLLYHEILTVLDQGFVSCINRDVEGRLNGTTRLSFSAPLETIQDIITRIGTLRLEELISRVLMNG